MWGVKRPGPFQSFPSCAVVNRRAITREMSAGKIWVVKNPPLPWSQLFCASGHNALQTTGAPRPLQKQFSFHSFFIFHIRWSCYSWRSSLRNTQDTQSVIFPVKLSQQLLGQTSPETKINNALGCPARFMKQKDKYGIVNITVWWQAVGVFYWLQDNDRSHSTWW